MCLEVIENWTVLIVKALEINAKFHRQFLLPWYWQLAMADPFVISDL